MKLVKLIPLLLLCFGLLIQGYAGEGKQSIAESKHNLSVTGKGNIKSSTETRICVFCHSSHNSSNDGPLWNHKTTSVTSFKTYDRSTLISRPEQPNGATKLCLSCHDGTIAVGAVRGLSQPIKMSNIGAGGEIPDGRKSNFGTDLTGTHPVSVRFDAGTALKNEHLRWPPDDPEKLVGTDSDGYIQCTSCHDPHGTRSEKYPFWKKSTFDEVCDACHTY